MRSYIVPAIVIVIAIALQLVIAPLLSFSSVVPNFLIPLAIVASIVRSSDSAYAYAFVLGLISDFMAQTPVGLSPFLLLIASFVLSRSFEVLDKTTMAMPLIATVVSIAVFEVLFAIGLLIMGYPASLIDLILYRIVPLVFFNSIIGVVYYLVMSKFSWSQSSPEAWSVSNSSKYH